MQFEQELAKGDKERARLLVHTLKGLAGTLGAQTLYKETMALEKAVKENHDSYRHHLDAVGHLLQTGFEEMNTAMPDRNGEKLSGKQIETAVDHNGLTAALKKLLLLLRNGDFESEDLFFSLAGQLSAVVPEKASLLEQQVSSLAFKEAAVEVEKLIYILGTPEKKHKQNFDD